MLIVVATIVVLLVAARIALPFVIKRQVNARLQEIPGYSGQVEDVGVALVRGAYNLRGLAIFREAGTVREPFFLADHIDFSVAWRELFRGKIVSDIYVDRPKLNVVKGPTDEETQRDMDRRWQQLVQDLFPIDITFFEIREGAVRYIDKTRAPDIDVFIKNMHVLATGLRNRPDESGEELPAKIQVEGDSLGGGRVRLLVQADPLAEQPHFHISAKVDGVNLPALNDSLKGIANVDVGRGTFRMAAEMAGKDGGFQGYVKPFFEDLDFRNLEDKQKGVGTRLWEKVVSGLAWLVKNKQRDQVGTRIPFEGRFGDPKVGLMTTIRNLFRHGFVRAFNPTVEQSLDPEDVLPSGKSASGRDVATTKTDPPVGSDVGAVGAPTGRPTTKAPKRDQ